MKFITFFEGVFFSVFYSNLPFLATDMLKSPLYGSPVFVSIQHQETSFLFITCFSFVLYWKYCSSGLRTRYVLWHLERRRISSGLSPIETLAVAGYHVSLCLVSEIIVPLLDGFVVTPSSVSWSAYVWYRCLHIFLFSVLQNIVFESCGLFDRLRVDYFNQDRD